MVRVRVVRPFRRAGEHVEPGTLLDVDAREARELVVTFSYAVLEDAETQPPPSAMVVDADPVVRSRDPVRRKHR